MSHRFAVRLVGLTLLVAGGGAVGDAQRLPVARPSVIAGDLFEASGVVAVPGTPGILFVDDGRPDEVMWMSFDGAGRQVGRAAAVPLGIRIPDLEDITFDGRFYYVVGSQSQGRTSGPGLARFRYEAGGSRVTGVQSVSGLRGLLDSPVGDLLSGRGRRGEAPVNIEGLTWDAARRRLIVGLRSPLARDNRALLVPLSVEGDSPDGSVFRVTPGAAIALDLGGLGVRGLGADAATGEILILGGAPDYAERSTFRLFSWNGAADMRPRLVAEFRARDKPEGVTRMDLRGQSRTLVLFDTGGFQWLE